MVIIMPKLDTKIEPKITPKAVLEKRSHRRFTTEYKLSILK